MLKLYLLLFSYFSILPLFNQLSKSDSQKGINSLFNTNVTSVFVAQKLVKEDSTLLDLSQKNIVLIPKEIETYKNLESLNLSYNTGLEIDQSFYELSKIKTLKNINLSHCKLTYVPYSINEIRNLEILDLSYNNLFEIPDMMHKLHKLKKVNLSDNSLKNLGYAPSLWINLESINLKNNPNLDMEEAFKSLSYLKNINKIEVNNLEIFPINTTLLKSREIVFENCSFKSTDTMFPEKSKIKTIVFNNCKKTDFDKILPIISTNKNLTELKLIDNDLTGLFIDSTQFPELKKLDLSGNRINNNDLEKLEKQFPNCVITTNKEKENTVIPIKREVNPPFKQAIIKPNLFTIHPEKEQTLTTTNSKIAIPKNAFLDQNNNIVKTPIIISYKEILNPVDQILSGIPMEYDSGGVTYNFESAGMLDFKAESSGAEVFPNPKALINIQLKSAYTDKNYGLYTLNDENGKWNYKRPSVQGKINDSTSNSNLETKLKPQKPHYTGSRKPTIGLEHIGYSIVRNKKNNGYYLHIENNNINNNFDYNEASSLIEFINTNRLELPKRKAREYRLFSNYTYRGKYKDKKHKYYKRFKDSTEYRDSRCIGIEMIVNREKDLYEVVISYISGEVRIPCKIKSKRNQITEQQDNLKFWLNYKEEFENIKNINSKIYKGYKSAMDKYEDELKEFQKEYRNYFIKYNDLINSQEKLNYIFELNAFQTWNCDRFSRNKQGIKIKAKFKNILKTIFIPVTIYIINKTKNGYEKTLKTNSLTYERQCNHSLMLIDKDGNVGLVSQEDFDLAIDSSDDIEKQFNYEFIKKSDINQDLLLEKLL